MGLVQAQEQNVTPETKNVKVGSTTIIWQNDIENLIHMYGTLIIDYYKIFMVSSFIVSFEGSSC
jgi:hypothetical protein